MSKLLPLAALLLLLPACGNNHGGSEPFDPDHAAHSLRGHFVYDADSQTGITLLSMTTGHQTRLGDPADPKRTLPCYRARSLDPSIFAITLPDGTVVPDAGICRPFGLADSFFGNAVGAGVTAVEIRDGNTAIDQIPIHVRAAKDVDLLVGQPPSDTAPLVLKLDQLGDFAPLLVTIDHTPVDAGLSAWTLRIADPAVAVLDNRTDLEMTAHPSAVKIVPLTIGMTTLTVTVADLSRDIRLVIQAPQR
jgi:hypothetical protein